MKRTFARILLTVILAVCLIPSAAAGVIAPLASDYFDGTLEVTVTAVTGGKLEVRAKASATGRMSKLGVSEIMIQKKGLIFWSDEAVKTGTVANGMLSTGTQYYDKIITLPAGLTAGEKYRAVVTFYAEDSSGSDSISKTSDAVTAK